MKLGENIHQLSTLCCQNISRIFYQWPSFEPFYFFLFTLYFASGSLFILTRVPYVLLGNQGFLGFNQSYDVVHEFCFGLKGKISINHGNKKIPHYFSKFYLPQYLPYFYMVIVLAYFVPISSLNPKEKVNRLVGSGTLSHRYIFSLK